MRVEVKGRNMPILHYLHFRNSSSEVCPYGKCVTFWLWKLGVLDKTFKHKDYILPGCHIA
jgi:hypothetical protein